MVDGSPNALTHTLLQLRDTLITDDSPEETLLDPDQEQLTKAHRIMYLCILKINE